MAPPRLTVKDYRPLQPTDLNSLWISRTTSNQGIVALPGPGFTSPCIFSVPWLPPAHGTGAETSFEYTLSFPLESTAVVT